MLMSGLHTREVTQSQPNTHPFWSLNPPLVVSVHFDTLVLQRSKSLHSAAYVCNDSKSAKPRLFLVSCQRQCFLTHSTWSPQARLYWFMGARVTLNSLARRAALPGSLDLGKPARFQGEEERMWKEVGHDRSPCFLSSSFSFARCWTGWRPTGPKDPGHQGTWRQHSRSR